MDVSSIKPIECEILLVVSGSPPYERSAPDRRTSCLSRQARLGRPAAQVQIVMARKRELFLGIFVTISNLIP
jgi:hypothetical protein